MIPFIYLGGQVGITKNPLAGLNIAPTLITGNTLHLDMTDMSQMHLNSGEAALTAAGQYVGLVKGRTSTLRGWRHDRVDNSITTQRQPTYQANQTPFGLGCLRHQYSTCTSNFLTTYNAGGTALANIQWGDLTALSASTIVAAVRVRACTPRQAQDYLNTAIISEAAGWSGLHVFDFDTDNVKFVAQNYASASYVSVSAPFPKGEWAIVSFQHANTTMRLRVNGGAWVNTVTVARGNIGSTVYLGDQGSVPNIPVDMDVAHIAVFNQVIAANLLASAELWMSMQTGIDLSWMR